MEVGSGSGPLRGLENRRPKGYAGSSPVPSNTQVQQLTLTCGEQQHHHQGIETMVKLPPLLVCPRNEILSWISSVVLSWSGSRTVI
jgi:hypothetical protein